MQESVGLLVGDPIPLSDVPRVDDLDAGVSKSPAFRVTTASRVHASALRTDLHCLRRLEASDPVMVESQRVVAPQRRADAGAFLFQAMRMHEQLWRYYPQFLEAVDDDVEYSWALRKARGEKLP